MARLGVVCALAVMGVCAWHNPELLEQRALSKLEHNSADHDATTFAAWFGLASAPRDADSMDLEESVGGQVTTPSFYFSKSKFEFWSALVLGDGWETSKAFVPYWRAFDNTKLQTFLRYQKAMSLKSVTFESWRYNMLPFLNVWPVMEHVGYAYDQFLQIYSDFMFALPSALATSEGKLQMERPLFAEKMKLRTCPNSGAQAALGDSVKQVTLNLLRQASYTWVPGDTADEDTPFTMCEFVRAVLRARGVITKSALLAAKAQWQSLKLRDSLTFVDFLKHMEKSHHIGAEQENTLRAFFRMVALNSLSKSDRSPLQAHELSLSPCEFQFLYILLHSTTMTMVQKGETAEQLFHDVVPCQTEGMTLNDFHVMLQMFSAAKVARESPESELIAPSKLYWDSGSDTIGGKEYTQNMFRAIACADENADISTLSVTHSAIVQYFKKASAGHDLQAESAANRLLPGKGSMNWQEFSRALLSNLPFAGMTEADVNILPMGKRDFRRFWLCLDQFVHQLQEHPTSQGVLPMHVQLPKHWGQISKTKAYRFSDYYDRCKHFASICESNSKCSAPVLQDGVTSSSCEDVALGSSIPCVVTCATGYTSSHLRLEFFCTKHTSGVQFSNPQCSAGAATCIQTPQEFFCTPLTCKAPTALPVGHQIVSGCLDDKPLGAPCVLRCKSGYTRATPSDGVVKDNFACEVGADGLAYVVTNFECTPQQCQKPSVDDLARKGLVLECLPGDLAVSSSCKLKCKPGAALATPSDVSETDGYTVTCIPSPTKEQEVGLFYRRTIGSGVVSWQEFKCEDACDDATTKQCLARLAPEALCINTKKRPPYTLADWKKGDGTRCCTKPPLPSDKALICEQGACLPAISRNWEYCTINLDDPSPTKMSLILDVFGDESVVEATAGTPSADDASWIVGGAGICKDNVCEERLCLGDTIKLAPFDISITTKTARVGAIFEFGCGTFDLSNDPSAKVKVQCRIKDSVKSLGSMWHQFEWQVSHTCKPVCQKASLEIPGGDIDVSTMPGKQRLRVSLPTATVGNVQTINCFDAHNGMATEKPLQRTSLWRPITWIGAIKFQCKETGWTEVVGESCIPCFNMNPAECKQTKAKMVGDTIQGTKGTAEIGICPASVFDDETSFAEPVAVRVKSALGIGQSLSALKCIGDHRASAQPTDPEKMFSGGEWSLGCEWSPRAIVRWPKFAPSGKTCTAGKRVDSCSCNAGAAVEKAQCTGKCRWMALSSTVGCCVSRHSSTYENYDLTLRELAGSVSVNEFMQSEENVARIAPALKRAGVQCPSCV